MSYTNIEDCTISTYDDPATYTFINDLLDFVKVIKIDEKEYTIFHQKQANYIYALNEQSMNFFCPRFFAEVF